MNDVGDSFLRQSDALRRWASARTAGEWALPSVLPHWTIRDLVAHVVIVHESLARTLTAGTPEPPVPLGEYVSTYSAHAEDLERLAQARAAVDSPEELLERLSELRDSLAVALVTPGPAVVASARGPVARDDFLRTRVLEVTVHSDDLARSLPEGPGPTLDPDALAETVGVLLEALAQQRPGAGQVVVVPGVGQVGVAGTPGRYELAPLDALRIFTGRRASESAPHAGETTRTDPTWGPVLA